MLSEIGRGPFQEARDNTGPFEIIGMVQILGNELFLWLMSDCDNRLLVPAEVMDGEVIPHTEKFSRWISWGAIDQV